MKLRITLLFLLVILASGCGVSSALPQKEVFKMGKNTWISNYEIIQTIDEGFGLAVSRSNFMVIAIKSSSEFYPMYDGEAIKGSFVMVDTYTYERKPDENGNRQFKTVPVVVPYSEIKSRATQ